MWRTVAPGHAGKRTRPTTLVVLAMQWRAILVLEVTAPPWIRVALRVFVQGRHPVEHTSFIVREDAALIPQAITAAATPTMESATSRSFVPEELIAAIATIAAAVDIVE